MHTCMFCEQAIDGKLINYSYFIPMGEDQPLRGSGYAHAHCIKKFERAQFDYKQLKRDLIAAWEKRLLQPYLN